MIRVFLDRKLMRLSRVTALSLCRRDLVYDPGGLRRTSPGWQRRILRSSTMKLSAVHSDENRRSRLGLSHNWDHNDKQLSRLNTNPVDLLPSASDLCFLRPTSSATGLLARLCPWKDLHLLDSINQFHREGRSRIPKLRHSSRHRFVIRRLNEYHQWEHLDTRPLHDDVCKLSNQILSRCDSRKCIA